jgi:hypothetical protein
MEPQSPQFDPIPPSLQAYWEIQYGPEWFAASEQTPAQRFEESAKQLANYLALGGSLAPEPDLQSPFYDPETPGTRPVDGGTGLRSVRIRDT